MIILIDAFKAAYLESLYEDFKSRQPHLVMRYIAHDTHSIDKMRKMASDIKHLSSHIEAAIPFVEGSGWFSTTGKGFFSSVSYQGEVSLVGVDFQTEGIYPYAGASFLPHGAYQIPYTLLEGEYELQVQPNRVIFNNALIHSHYPPVVSGGRFIFRDNNNRASQLELIASFEDYSDQPGMYGSISMVNRLLDQDANRMDGLYLYLDDLKAVDEIARVLRLHISDNNLKMVVTSWTENEKKRRELFLLYEVMSWAIIAMALLLGLVLALIVLYRAVIARGRDMVILGYLGYLAAKDLMISSIIVSMIALALALGMYYFLLPIMLNLLDLPLHYPWSSTLALAVGFLVLYIIFMMLTVLSALRVSFSR